MTLPLIKRVDQRSHRIHRMGIEITFRCNLSCNQCDHHCDQRQLEYINDSDMTLEQIDYFIEEVRKTDTIIIRLSMTGGEALVHPQVFDIGKRLHKELLEYKYVYRRRVRTISNGILTPPAGMNLYCHVKTLMPLKERTDKHCAMLTAPRDVGQEVRCFHGAGCNIPFRCGLVLNKFGYFPCGPGGAIIRLFNMTDWIRYELPVEPWNTWDLARFREEVCRLCQYGGRCPSWLSIQEYPQPSKSFKQALAHPPKSFKLYGA